ncbi:MAG: glycosyltransferase [Clostridia bacterium]|nr:glycosyltransferase [Clostridia bacterium]
MHLLILSANTGEGHNSAAKALKEYFETRGDRCTVQDGLAFLPRTKGELICRGHVFFYRKLPKVYGIGYRFEEFQAQHQPYQRQLIRQVSRRKRAPRNVPSLKAYLEAGGFDAVLCVHVFVARLVSELRRKGELGMPCFFLATDYTCSPGVNQLDMHGWLIPHPALVPEFASYGIPEEKIIPAGIPVRDEFLSRGDRDEARRELGLPEDKRIAVLSCGSMGAGPMGKLVLLLTEMLPKDALLIAICGSNRKLERNLKYLVRSKKLLVKGYVKHMHRYLDAADVFLTKPGGLSTTEAMHKGLPLILINMAPGCETRNMEFLTGIGCAAASGGAISMGKIASSMLNASEDRQKLSQKCREEFGFDPREVICNTIKNSIHS